MLCVLIVPTVCSAHVVLDPDVVQDILRDVTRFRRAAQDGPTEEARLQALYDLGQTVDGLVDRLNMDRRAHGADGLLATLVVRRLEQYGIHAWLEEEGDQYVYDFAAFHEYLKRAPNGSRALDIRYRLIADVFYRTMRLDTPGMLRGDVADLLAAVNEQERFLEDFPDDERTLEVRLFRATDYYRLFKNTSDAEKAARYRVLAVEALEELLMRHAGTPEARTAEGLLERIGEIDGD